jgi:para-aminobenzoate synthetase component I
LRLTEMSGTAQIDTTLLLERTPMPACEAVLRLLDLPRPVFLDNSLADERAVRYSYLTADPFLVIRSRGRRVEVTRPHGRTVLEGDPFEILRHLLSAYHVEPLPYLPPFVGGAVGYFGYDLGWLLERLPEINSPEGSLPEMDIGFYDWALATDHLKGENWLMATGLPTGDRASARRRVAAVRELLTSPPVEQKESGGRDILRLRSNFSREEYVRAVNRVKEYIAAGDVYQVNVSHRLEGEYRGHSWPLYERLRVASPVSHGAYLNLGEVTILSASPERFLRLNGDEVQTRPIKGTRPRSQTPEEDKALAEELLSSEKDRAENLMIVDLLRNDLGKVCRIGSVRVPELFGLEGYASVWHLVSTIRGELRPELDAVDLLKACFPGGSITGAPKIRAMEIIEELEPVRRGIYCGAIGYISFTGTIDTSIAIRTLVLKDQRIHLQVGGGVVADSDSEAEYEETISKGQALFSALGAELETR